MESSVFAYTCFHRRRRALLNPITDVAQPSPHLPAGPKKDYSLKEGQTFSIAIPGHARLTTLASQTSSVNNAIPLLPPPPTASRKR
jgi:hypothetical protein